MKKRSFFKHDFVASPTKSFKTARKKRAAKGMIITMTHKKPITKIIAGVLSVVMVFGVLMLVSHTEAQAISLNAIDTGFYNVSYDGRETIFGVGSQIRVENKLRTSKNSATYTLTEEGWKTTDAFVWNGASKNEFEAWYPFNASYTEFTIPIDQSSDQLLGAADWMTASSGKIDKPENHTLNLYFTHQLSKVTVNITEWNSEFDGSEKIIDDLKIYSKGTALTATYGDSGATITATDGETGITPLESDTSYTAIVAPAKYANTDKFLTFTACGQEMTVLATPPSLNEEGLQAGLHYRFDLEVGKDGVTLSSVTVSDWANGGTIDGGVATEGVATLNAAGYYEIGNAAQLFWFAQQVNVEGNKEIKGALTADIDLKYKPWTPIGAMGEENSFRGVFDGQNYTIRGLNVEGSKNGVGFFGEVRTGTVKNFTIYGEVVVNTEVDCVGGVIGSICGVNGETDLERNGAIIQNITSYVNVTANAHGVGMIGGFVGYADHQSLIEKCSWYGTFDAGIYRVDSGAGGFIGKIQENTGEVTIRNCAAYGTIKTDYAKNSFNSKPTIYMGGFLSFSNTGAKTTLENCLFAGKFERGANLTDEARLGAFGTLRSVNAIKNCYYLGDDGLEAVHSDSPLNLGSDNVEITSVTEDDLRNNTIATRLGVSWEQGEHYPVIKK